MRRVVVTGMGIVSSIGNNTQEVLASLREAEIRHRAGRQIRGARLSLPGARCAARSTPPTSVDRRAMRFLGRRRSLESRGHGAGDPRFRR